MEGREYVIYLYTNKAIFPRVSSCKRSTSPHSAQWNQSKSAERQLWEQYRTYAKYEHSVKKKKLLNEIGMYTIDILLNVGFFQMSPTFFMSKKQEFPTE